MYFICVDLTLVAFSDITDAVILQCHPIVSGFHYLSCHYVPTSMCTADPFMNLVHNFLGLVSVDTSQKHLVLTFLVQNVPVQKESHG